MFWKFRGGGIPPIPPPWLRPWPRALITIHSFALSFRRSQHHQSQNSDRVLRRNLAQEICYFYFAFLVYSTEANFYYDRITYFILSACWLAGIRATDKDGRLWRHLQQANVVLTRSLRPGLLLAQGSPRWKPGNYLRKIHWQIKTVDQPIHCAIFFNSRLLARFKHIVEGVVCILSPWQLFSGQAMTKGIFLRPLSSTRFQLLRKIMKTRLSEVTSWPLANHALTRSK